MSAQLTASVPPSWTTWVLEQIDERSEETAPSGYVSLQHGPFGVLQPVARQM